MTAAAPKLTLLFRPEINLGYRSGQRSRQRCRDASEPDGVAAHGRPSSSPRTCWAWRRVTATIGAGALNRLRAGTLCVNVRQRCAHRPLRCPAGLMRRALPRKHRDLSW